MPIGHLEAAFPDASAGQEQQNEDGFIRELLWRRKYLVAAFCAVGLLVASVVAMFIADRYTSEVVIQTRFVRPQLQIPAIAELGNPNRDKLYPLPRYCRRRGNPPRIGQ